MASIKATMSAVLILVILAGLGGGVAYGVRLWQQRQVTQDLDLAQSYLAQGRPQQAAQILTARIDRASPTAPWVDRAMSLQFQVVEALKDRAAKQGLVDKILDPRRPWGQPGQESWARAHLFEADQALQANKADVALTHLTLILSQPAGGWGKDEATLGLARIEMAKGNLTKAKAMLIPLMDQLAENSSTRPAVEYALGLCNKALLTSGEQEAGDHIYLIQKGDSIDRIRRNLRKQGVEISAEVLMGVNQISDPRRLTIGRRLKIPNIEFSIVVNKTDNTLTLFNHGKFFKKYRVRTGSEEYMTPVGEYRINNKMVNPTWHDPKENKSYGPNDPGNQLGCRWMEFQSSLGIHEALEPGSIGTYSSHGCVGMLKQDVVELYDLVPLRTSVKVIGQKSGANEGISIKY